MQQYKAHRTITRRRAWPLAIIAGGVILSGLPVSSQAASTCTDQSCPADFIQLVSPEIQASKTSFKFQARLSQAKLPVDVVEFPKVIVKLKDANNIYCSQSLNKVKVRDSVINIEVGPDTGMTCSMPLEEVVGSKSGLLFQICINNEENCLKPIALSSVPYSVKAEYARRAQQSFEADVAAQAHYAHRIAADLDLLQAPTIGTGYYDFHSPLVPIAINTVPVSNKEGVMQWTPVNGADKKLNIALKTEANGAVPASLTRLDELKLHALLTKAWGKLEVAEGTNLKSTLDVALASKLAGTLDVTGVTKLLNTLTVSEAGTFNKTLKAIGNTTLSTVTASGLGTFQAGLTVTGGNTSLTTLSTSANAGLNSLEVGVAPNLATIDSTGYATFPGMKLPANFVATFDGTVNFNGPVNLPSNVGISMASLNVAGATTVGGAATFSSTGSFAGALTVPVGGLEMGNADNIVLGHSSNSVAAGVTGATIGGGGLPSSGVAFSNTIAASQAVVAGGRANTISSAGLYATIGGGQVNKANATTATVAGGSGNTASGDSSAIGGGGFNAASGGGSVIAGGSSNTASGPHAVVSGGFTNVSSGSYSTLAGGFTSSASGNYATMSGGINNIVDGIGAVVPGGAQNQATGTNSFAAGQRAKARNQGCFVWSDNSNTAVDVNCSNDNRWVARTAGGVYFYTSAGATSGVSVAAGGSAWTALSDRNVKHDIKALDPKAVLKKLEDVPVSTWRYNTEESKSLHMGPMAQDFYKAFGLGEDDKHIVTIDADGVALAAVKGVHQITKEQGAQLDSLTTEVKSLRNQNRALEARLAKLEAGGSDGRSVWHGAGMFGVLGFAGLGLMLVTNRRRKDLP